MSYNLGSSGHLKKSHVTVRDWKSVAKVGNISFESATVNICDGICDSCDLCGIESCEFYDTSPEATKRFLLANAREHTAEHLLAPIS